ncbi:uncharacterized protein DNG_09349 [Cephalotrichum gorgonifer]|uniref:Uncharacterized protein n=1 Tax=Cephalotrichum gorgonifer TaxID=2041049 RepID=A0AAE8N833_9PEZI|nr:uncharacterized protein DNG_09349 [Cephalotrichum gorgonifer]
MSSDGNSNDGKEPGGDNSTPSLPGLPPLPTTALPATGDGNLGVSCEKDPNCDTGASLRKLISHFFGRNKKCTRSIPAHVWVHWCRKHYQRERYNKNTGYAMTQADLLVIQLRRIRDWSDENERKGETSGVVQSWELRLRKREANRRRGLSNADANSDEDDDGESGWVPEWLSVQLGEGYTTEQIQDMVEQLHSEVHTGVLHKMPDIEFLPSISGDVPRRAPRSRAQTSHRRTQSQGVSPAAAATAGPSNASLVAGTSHVPTASGRATMQASAAPGPAVSTSSPYPPSDGTLSTAPNDFVHMRRPSRSQQAINESGNPPRAEKRKAGETLEASMTPPSARRIALTHRPAYSQSTRANTLPRAVGNTMHSMSSGHSRSRSDMSHLESNYDRWSGRIVPDPGRDIRSGDSQVTFHSNHLYPGHPMVEFSERQGHSRRISTPGSYHYSQGNTNTNTNPLTLSSTVSYETPRLTLGMGVQRGGSGVTLPPISALAGEDGPPVPFVGLSAGDAREALTRADPPRDTSRGRSRGSLDGGYPHRDDAAEDENRGEGDSGY